MLTARTCQPFGLDGVNEKLRSGIAAPGTGERIRHPERAVTHVGDTTPARRALATRCNSAAQLRSLALTSIAATIRTQSTEFRLVFDS
jgi:hypothetical protein